MLSMLGCAKRCNCLTVMLLYPIMLWFICLISMSVTGATCATCYGSWTKVLPPVTQQSLSTLCSVASICSLNKLISSCKSRLFDLAHWLHEEWLLDAVLQCVEVVLGMISDSLDAWRTRQYDYYQRVLNGILWQIAPAVLSCSVSLQPHVQ